ncbi:hypothetical protein C8J56DRAFT_890194 [Mycena floridula]|nr:hypothetical protein C8J56DRAFT_890194 [Mycena floridula]
MLPVILQHIDISPPTAMPPAETITEAELLALAPNILLIIQCLNALVLGIHSLSTGEEAKELLSKYWTPLYGWLQFIVESVIASEVFLRNDDTRHSDLCEAVCELLAITRDEISANCLPNQRTLSTRLWLYSARAGSSLIKLYGVIMDNNESPTRGLNISTVVAEFPGGAEIVIGELQRVSRRNKNKEDCITLGATFMLISYAFPTNCSRVHPMPLLRRQFASAGVIPALVQLMSRLTSSQKFQYIGEDEVFERGQLYHVASSLLVDAIDYLGPSAVHQAFAYGIVNIIIAAVPLLRLTDDLKSCTKLTQTLSSIFIQPYILRQAKRRIDVASLSSLINSAMQWMPFDPLLFSRVSNFIPDSTGKPVILLLANLHMARFDHSALYSYARASKLDYDYAHWCITTRAADMLNNTPGAMDSYLIAQSGKHPAVIVFVYTRLDHASYFEIFSGEKFLELNPQERVLRLAFQNRAVGGPDEAVIYATIPDHEKTYVPVYWASYGPHVLLYCPLNLSRNLQFRRQLPEAAVKRKLNGTGLPKIRIHDNIEVEFGGAFAAIVASKQDGGKDRLSRCCHIGDYNVTSPTSSPPPR